MEIIFVGGREGRWSVVQINNFQKVTFVYRLFLVRSTYTQLVLKFKNLQNL